MPTLKDMTPAGRGADWYPKLEYPGRRPMSANAGER